jgi:hypothetical protein
MSTRMSGADTAWLRMERPTNPMVITAVLVFKTRLEPARMKQALRTRFLAFQRFRSSTSSAMCIASRCRVPAASASCRIS